MMDILVAIELFVWVFSSVIVCGTWYVRDNG